MNRFKSIINDYEDTEYVEEALHRLVEINYKSPNLPLLS